MTMEQYIINRLNLLEAVVEKQKAENDRAQQTIDSQQAELTEIRSDMDRIMDLMVAAYKGDDHRYGWVTISCSVVDQVLNILGTSCAAVDEVAAMLNEEVSVDE